MAMQSQQRSNNNTSLLFGIIIASAGVLYLLKQFKLIEFDIHIWPLFLIVGGIMSGMKKGFLRPTPLILVTIGIAFMIPDFTIAGVASRKLLWPVLLILSGLFIAFRPKKKLDNLNLVREDFAKRFDGDNKEKIEVDENFVNIEAYFGGRKEIITSKQFSGCAATAICGGAEINLMQADNIIQPMVIDLRVVFGGIEIIVPSHWEIVNEVDVLFGGIEDKRNLRTAADIGESKKLLLRGSVTFGGLELKSY